MFSGTTMAELETAQRNKLPASSFAVTVEQNGHRVGKLPIHDESHVRNALARFDQTKGLSESEKRTAAKRILSAAHRHGIEVAEGDAVWRAAHGGD